MARNGRNSNNNNNIGSSVQLRNLIDALNNCTNALNGPAFNNLTQAIAANNANSQSLETAISNLTNAINNNTNSQNNNSNNNSSNSPLSNTPSSLYTAEELYQITKVLKERSKMTDQMKDKVGIKDVEEWKLSEIQDAVANNTPLTQDQQDILDKIKDHYSEIEDELKKINDELDKTRKKNEKNEETTKKWNKSVDGVRKTLDLVRQTLNAITQFSVDIPNKWAEIEFKIGSVNTKLLNDIQKFEYEIEEANINLEKIPLNLESAFRGIRNAEIALANASIAAARAPLDFQNKMMSLKGNLINARKADAEALKNWKKGMEGVLEPWIKVSQASADFVKNIGGSKEEIKDITRESLQMAEARNIEGKYNTSVEELIKLQSKYNEQLGRAVKLTNDQKENLAALKSVVGDEKSVDFITKLATFGFDVNRASGRVTEMFKNASKYGLSFSKFSKNLLDNIKMAQTYSFASGVKGLTRMAEQATALNFNMQETAKAADKLSTLEGAMEAASNLSVLGGNFSAYSNPLAMLGEALMDPEALQNRIVDMFSDSAHWDSEKGEIAIDPGQLIKIKEASKSLGMSADEATNMVMSKARQDRLRPEVDALNVSDDIKKKLLNTAQLDERGNGFINYRGEQMSLSEASRLDPKELEKYLSIGNNDDSSNIREIASSVLGVKDIIEGWDKKLDDTSAGITEFTGIGQNFTDTLQTQSENVEFMKGQANNILQTNIASVDFQKEQAQWQLKYAQATYQYEVESAKLQREQAERGKRDAEIQLEQTRIGYRLTVIGEEKKLFDYQKSLPLRKAQMMMEVNAYERQAEFFKFQKTQMMIDGAMQGLQLAALLGIAAINAAGMFNISLGASAVAGAGVIGGITAALAGGFGAYIMGSGGGTTKTTYKQEDNDKLLKEINNSKNPASTLSRNGGNASSQASYLINNNLTKASSVVNNNAKNNYNAKQTSQIPFKEGDYNGGTFVTAQGASQDITGTVLANDGTLHEIHTGERVVVIPNTISNLNDYESNSTSIDNYTDMSPHMNSVNSSSSSSSSSNSYKNNKTLVNEKTVVSSRTNNVNNRTNGNSNSTYAYDRTVVSPYSSNVNNSNSNSNNYTYAYDRTVANSTVGNTNYASYNFDKNSEIKLNVSGSITLDLGGHYANITGQDLDDIINKLKENPEFLGMIARSSNLYENYRSNSGHNREEDPYRFGDIYQV